MCLCECQSKGSSPQATIEWVKDKMALPKVAESFSEDGFVTTSFITLLPSMEDHGKLLACRARNSQFPGLLLEDGFVMNVHCKQKNERKRKTSETDSCIQIEVDT